MRFYIHENTYKNNKSDSGKAIYFTHSYSGLNSGRTIEWFPISQITIGIFNEVGWASIDIPDWLLTSKSLMVCGSLSGGFEELEFDE